MSGADRLDGPGATGDGDQTGDHQGAKIKGHDRPGYAAHVGAAVALKEQRKGNQSSNQHQHGLFCPCRRDQQQTFQPTGLRWPG